MKFRDRALLKLLGLMMLAVLTFGCATVSKVGAVAKQCEPSTAQMDKLITALTSSVVKTEAVAAAMGLGFVACVLEQGTNEIIASLEPKPGTAALALESSSYSPLLDNAKALKVALAAHP